MSEWVATLKRAGRETLDDHMVLIAQALAFSTFLAIPSVLLVVLGVLTFVADTRTVDSLVSHFQDFMPGQSRQLVSDGLHRLAHEPKTSLTMTAVGLILALWSTTSAMTHYMTALDLAYDRRDARGFTKRRLVALAMVACLGAAFVLLAALLIFGPAMEREIAGAVGHPTLVGAIWWVVQWPILVAGLLLAFATMLYLGPDIQVRNWRLATPGALVAAVVWLASSGALAFYTAHFHSFNRAWGSLSAVIVTLLWLWLAGLALLFGAELDSEIEHDEDRATASASAIADAGD